MTPPAMVHFALEIEKEDYENSKNMLNQNKIEIEKEIIWKKGTKSMYFRDQLEPNSINIKILHFF
jgi:hypothetical protein